LVYPPPPGALLVKPGELIKVASRNVIAVVTVVSNDMISYRIIEPGRRHVTAEGFRRQVFESNFGSGKEYHKYDKDPRETYLGKNPKIQDIGAAIKSRMARQGNYRRDNGGEILYFRDSDGNPLSDPTKARWVNVRNCDLGHIVDAVSWWNSNGRLTYAQSPTVLEFMNDPSNYELEPSAVNQRRGALLAARGVRYLLPPNG
jgi:hypothetical protein